MYPQPWLSSVVKKVEQEIKTPIFDRSTTPISLTPAGQYYIQQVEKVMKIEEEMRTHFAQLSSQETKLHIGSSMFFCTYVLPQLFQEFREENPQITLTLTEGGSESMVEKITQPQTGFLFGGRTAANKRQDSIGSMVYGRNCFGGAGAISHQQAVESILLFFWWIAQTQWARQEEACRSLGSLPGWALSPLASRKRQLWAQYAAMWTRRFYAKCVCFSHADDDRFLSGIWRKRSVFPAFYNSGVRSTHGECGLLSVGWSHCNPRDLPIFVKTAHESGAAEIDWFYVESQLIKDNSWHIRKSDKGRAWALKPCPFKRGLPYTKKYIPVI